MKTTEVSKILGMQGKIFGSKSMYHEEYPDTLVIFNANICTPDGKKIWYGDIDVTKDSKKLKKVASTLKKELYVLREMDARFENEEKPLVNKYVYKTDGDSDHITEEDYKVIKGKIVYSPDMSEFKIAKTIKFGDIDVFKSNKKTKNSPITKFFDFLVKELNLKIDPKKQGLDVSKFYLTKEDYSWFEYLILEWAKINYPKYPLVKVKQSIQMELFDIGPGCFMENRYWMRDGYIYIREGSYLIERNEEKVHGN